MWKSVVKIVCIMTPTEKTTRVVVALDLKIGKVRLIPNENLWQVP